MDLDSRYFTNYCSYTYEFDATLIKFFYYKIHTNPFKQDLNFGHVSILVLVNVILKEKAKILGKQKKEITNVTTCIYVRFVDFKMKKARNKSYKKFNFIAF